MIKFFTMEFTSPVKAVPIIIPTAKSSILPLRAKFFKFNKEIFHNDKNLSEYNVYNYNL